MPKDPKLWAEARGLKGRERGGILGETIASPPHQLGDMKKPCKLP